jgi:TorA maturation chaperone TorD
MTNEAHSPDALIRSNNYRQIYHLFEYPSPEKGISLSREMDIDFPDGESAGQLKAVQDRLTEFFQGVTDTEELEAEYVRLFDYRPACPPYENAYRRDFLAHDLVSDLATFYREAGARCGDARATDHVSVEFEFMHYLCYQEAVAAPAERVMWRERQRLFLKNHLMVWVPSFAEALVKQAASPYCLLGELVKALMEIESLFLAEREGEPDA